MTLKPIIDSTDTNEKRLFASFFIFFTLLHLFLICTTRLYPFLDISNHLALATIYKYYGLSGNQFEHYYALDLFPKPNVFHMLFCGSKIFSSVEFANTIYYCLYAVLFPFSVLGIIKKLGGNCWFALLSFLLLYNLNVTYGFAGFTLALPCILFVVYFILDDFKTSSARAKLAVMALLIALFFMHALAAVFALLLYALYGAYISRHSLQNAAKALLAIMPSLVLIMLWWLNDTAEFKGDDLLTALYAYYKNSYVHTLFLRAGFLIHDNFRIDGGVRGYCAALFFSIVIIGSAVVTLFANKKTFSTTIKKTSFAIAALFSACTLTCVLFFPDTMPGYSFLFERFSVLFMVSLILLGSMFACAPMLSSLKVCIVISCFVHFFVWADCFHDFNKENNGFDKTFFSENQTCATMAALMYDYRFRNISVYDNFLDYYIVWNQGIAATRSIDERSFPVKRKVPRDLLPPYLEWVGKYNNYDGRYNNTDCILVRGDIPLSQKIYLKAFTLLKSAGKWALYKKM
ncbi:MAG: hypothetical protein WCQ99_03665 [Pseudomonadota bacterium]